MVLEGGGFWRSQGFEVGAKNLRVRAFYIHFPFQKFFVSGGFCLSSGPVRFQRVLIATFYRELGTGISVLQTLWHGNVGVSVVRYGAMVLQHVSRLFLV